MVTDIPNKDINTWADADRLFNSDDLSRSGERWVQALIKNKIGKTK